MELGRHLLLFPVLQVLALDDLTIGDIYQITGFLNYGSGIEVPERQPSSQLAEVPDPLTAKVALLAADLQPQSHFLRNPLLLAGAGVLIILKFCGP